MNQTDKQANEGCGKGTTSVVGSLSVGASPYGALDMAGNVAEWTSTWYKTNHYKYMVTANPKGPAQGLGREVRGGSFADVGSKVEALYRGWLDPVTISYAVGFRCVREPDE
jgi:formylglycine-generating enzyme required for sulfatase activity